MVSRPGLRCVCLSRMYQSRMYRPNTTGTPIIARQLLPRIRTMTTAAMPTSTCTTSITTTSITTTSTTTSRDTSALLYLTFGCSLTACTVPADTTRRAAGLPFGVVAAFQLASSSAAASTAGKASLVLGVIPTPTLYEQISPSSGTAHGSVIPHAQDTTLLSLPHRSVFLSNSAPPQPDIPTLRGKAAIARFMAKTFPSSGLGGSSAVTAEHQLKQRALIDEWIMLACDLKHSAETVALKVEESLISSSSPLSLIPDSTSNALTLAELSAWDVLKNAEEAGSLPHLPPKTTTWFKAMSSHPVLEAAVQQVKSVKNQQSNLIDLFREPIVDQMSALTGASKFAISRMLETPKDLSNGDIGIPLPRLRLPGNPKEVAVELASKFVVGELITHVKPVNTFIYFRINRALFTSRLLPQILSAQRSFGDHTFGFARTAVLDFSSPNIAKPFHAGHLRSTIIGNFIQNVWRKCGFSTTSINYLGDWGKQYGLLAVGYEKYGSEEALREDPIRHLFEVYVKINADATDDPAVHDAARAYFKRMEEGNADAIAIWTKFRDLSIERYKAIYARLNVRFDVYSGESRYSLQEMGAVIKELLSLGLLVEDANAFIVDLKARGLGAAVIQKADGSMLYLSRDIAAAIDRYEEYRFDRMAYVVGAQQEHHFKQLFTILEMMGKPWASRCQHVQFGLIKSKDGNMSTRKGSVIFLQDILDQVQEEMHGVMRKNEKKYEQIEDPVHVSDVVGMSSIMIQDMSARRIKEYEFDWNRMLSFEGDTGPYLQYAHTRLCSIERNAKFSVLDGSDVYTSIKYELLVEPQALGLIDLISTYPSVVKAASETLEPANLVAFALRLSHAVSGAYDALWVMNQPDDVARARLALYTSCRLVLGGVLELLGLRPLDRM